jgi:hypothetical protein
VGVGDALESDASEIDALNKDALKLYASRSKGSWRWVHRTAMHRGARRCQVENTLKFYALKLFVNSVFVINGVYE